MSTTAMAMSMTKDGKKSTKTINYISPTATDTEINNLATAITQLTTSELVDVTKVTKTSVSAVKTPSTISFSTQPDGSGTSTYNTVSDSLSVWMYINTNSDATPVVSGNTAYASAEIIRATGDGYEKFVLITSRKDPWSIMEDDSEVYTDINGDPLSKVGYIQGQQPTDETAKVTITLPATDTYAETSAPLYIRYA